MTTTNQRPAQQVGRIKGAFRLRRSRLTSNYVGTLFGGSLFAMTDPFWMIMMIRNLGPGYVVWDKAGEIEFVSPGRSSVMAEFVLDPQVVDEVRAAPVATGATS